MCRNTRQMTTACPRPTPLGPSQQVRLVLGTLCLAALLAPGWAWAERLALVIGNRDYAVGALKNPINDAQAIEQVLRQLGFQVTLVRNLKRDEIGRTIDAFAARVRPGDDIVVFYAGHGIQVKGVNYLPAVDAAIATETDVPLNSINLNQLVERMDEAKAGVRLFLVDACRDNPYASRYRSAAQGLARMDAAPSGTLMHFATRPGGIAFDGSGENGLYTKHLVAHLAAPGVPVESVLERVATGVRLESDGQQQPWTEGALDGEFFFAPPASTVAALPTATPPQGTTVATPVAPPSTRAAALTEEPMTTAAARGANGLFRFQGVVFAVLPQQVVVRVVPKGRRIGLQPGDEVLGCQRAAETQPWDHRPLLVQDLASRCQRETAQNGRSFYLLKIRREGEVMLRPVPVSD
jgi:uncharacterized caspase-like protein